MKFYTTSQLIKQYYDILDNNDYKVQDLYQQYNYELYQKHYVEVTDYYMTSMLNQSWLFKQAQPQTKEALKAGVNKKQFEKFLKGEALSRLLDDLEDYQPRNISTQGVNGLHRLVISHNLLTKDETKGLLNDSINILIEDEYDFEQIFVSLFEHYVKVSSSDLRFTSVDSDQTIHYFAKNESDTSTQLPYKFEKGSILKLKLISHQSEGTIRPIIVAHITNSSYTVIIPFDNLLQNNEIYHKIKKYMPSLFVTKNIEVLEKYSK